MTVLIPKESSLKFSSDPASGAQNVSTDGSTFSVTLNTPIQIPRSAMYATIEVAQAEIWNTSPNIAAAFDNNIFTFTTSDVGNPGTHTFTIPDGLYSRVGLDGYLSSSFANLGVASNLIVLSEDEATQRTILTFLLAGDSVDFTVANSVREVLGFDSRIAPTAPKAAGWNEISDDPASFNRVNSYLVLSNLVSNGIPVNNVAPGVIAAVPIDKEPGRQINYGPQSPTRVDASELIGGSKLNIRFSLVDQLLRPTPTAGEVWSILVTFRWGVLLTSGGVPLMSV